MALLLAAIPIALPAQAGTPVPAAQLVEATPAMWEIRDGDTIIYLFGTFHTLDGRTAWLGDPIRTAFDRSDELVLETLVPADLKTMNSSAGRALAQSDNSKPFIAHTKTVVSEGRSLGMSVEHGADAVLRRLAEDRGKPVGGLERFEEQLKILSNIPSPPPAAAAAAPVPAAPVTLNSLLTAWTRGDTRAFSTMLAGFEAKSPTAYRMLIADRNARWGRWLEQRLHQPGTVFVAVGSGHLAGKDSVQQWLARRGITATRVA
ncbi:MAG TPA: TraB/GumN family protein [Sphingomicrobium sp.]|nr:TraB/GumN family protein [Sphingomicrobium sp.]